MRHRRGDLHRVVGTRAERLECVSARVRNLGYAVKPIQVVILEQGVGLLWGRHVAAHQIPRASWRHRGVVVVVVYVRRTQRVRHFVAEGAYIKIVASAPCQLEVVGIHPFVSQVYGPVLQRPLVRPQQVAPACVAAAHHKAHVVHHPIVVDVKVERGVHRAVEVDPLDGILQQGELPQAALRVVGIAVGIGHCIVWLIVVAGIAVLIRHHHRARRGRTVMGQHPQVAVACVFEIIIHRHACGGAVVKHAVDGAEWGGGTRRLVGKAYKDYHVVQCSVVADSALGALGQVDFGLTPGVVCTAKKVLVGHQPGLQAGCFGVVLSGLQCRRIESAVDRCAPRAVLLPPGIYIEACGGVLHNGVPLGIVQPIVEFVARRVAVQCVAVGLDTCGRNKLGRCRHGTAPQGQSCQQQHESVYCVHFLHISVRYYRYLPMATRRS